MNKLLFLFIALLILNCKLSFADQQPVFPAAKHIILSGKILDQTSNEYLAGVKIVCTNCDKIFYSDLNGSFFIYLEVTEDRNLQLEFSQIGYSSKSITLQSLQSGSDNLYIDLKSE